MGAGTETFGPFAETAKSPAPGKAKARRLFVLI